MTRLRGYEAEAATRPTEVAPNSVLTVFRVPPESAGQRADVFLQGQLRRTSRTRTQVIIRASAFDASGRRMKPNDRVQAEQEIFLWRAPWDETPVPRAIPVLYEDPHLMAVDKPPNLPVHPTARYHHNTLIKMLQAERPGVFLSLGHRLDRETSGLLLVSKTSECDRALKRMLEARTSVEKTYLAITWGIPSLGDCPIGSTFRVERKLELDPSSPLRVKMRVSDGEAALASSTRFTVTDTLTSSDGRRYARVVCDLETGRQHQIRVHLQSLGTPIVGDKLYGPDETLFARGADGVLTPEDEAQLELPRHALHAARLQLPHPITGAPLDIRAPVPADLDEFWSARQS